jgi:Protein of unknown function (DUF2933)
MNHTDRAAFLPKDAVKWAAGSGLVLLAGAVALSADFRSLLWNEWPFLILLLCPLMHVFMHRGHGVHGGSGHHGGGETPAPSKTNRGSLEDPRDFRTTRRTQAMKRRAGDGAPGSLG